MYVIKNKEVDRYIAIDRSSGGYPYDTKIEYAKIWKEKKSAYEYYSIFKNENWELEELEFKTKKTSWI